jgi:glycosyltransferase involved in cell wall biosynthesis
VALVHDWLTGMRGGEKCLEAFCELFPEADLYTLIYVPEMISAVIQSMKPRSSWIGRLPAIRHYYRYCLPLFPSAIERLELAGYDLILSSSHCVAKGILPHRALHVSYLHSPMRYVWDLHGLYFGPGSPFLTRTAMALCRRYLQRWDIRSAERVDFYLANSKNVALKIKELYRRNATVIHPPVDLERFYIHPRPEPYFLIVSALVPYKRVDIAVEAFNELRLPLKIAGDGPLRRKLQKKAGPTIEFLGWVEEKGLADLYASCQALIFPGEDDFGIAPLEAQASGRPVIAYGRGGALETVAPLDGCNEVGKARSEIATGILFKEPSVSALVAAVEEYRKNEGNFSPAALRSHASRFSRESFMERLREYIEKRLQEHRGRG